MDSKEQRYSVSSAHRLNEDNQVESKQSTHNVKEKYYKDPRNMVTNTVIIVRVFFIRPGEIFPSPFTPHFHTLYMLLIHTEIPFSLTQ